MLVIFVVFYVPTYFILSWHWIFNGKLKQLHGQYYYYSNYSTRQNNNL